MKKIILTALLCVSFNSFAGCKPSDLYGKWNLVSVDKNESVINCDLKINKKGIVQGFDSQCHITTPETNERFQITNEQTLTVSKQCDIYGLIALDSLVNYGIEAKINPSKSIITGVIFNKIRSLVVMTRN